jgi:hypothetical protein
VRRLYGAGPGHLIAHVLMFALAGWAILEITDVGGASTILLWFIGAVIIHDALVLPLYSGADRGAQGIAFVLDRGGSARVPVINHFRVPLALSAVTLLVFAPLIFGRGDAALERVSGIDPSGYGLRWLLLTLALFAGSAIVYAIRVLRADPGEVG